MKAQLTAAAATLMGSGWASLAWEPMGERLVAAPILDHQSNVVQGAETLMVIDGWEHAYYLQYKNQKAEFFQAVWNLWDWDDVGARLADKGVDASNVHVETDDEAKTLTLSGSVPTAAQYRGGGRDCPGQGRRLSGQEPDDRGTALNGRRSTGAQPMWAMTASPNALHLTSWAPSMRRAKS